ncbi:MAG TPA: ThiS-like ubiquitin domain-containing protein, partial [Desulfuromonadaceae bacterium]
MLPIPSPQMRLVMNIRINEKPAAVADGLTLAEAAARFKPGADVLILNGFPASPDTMVR